MIIGILVSILCGISITRFINHLFIKIAFVQDIYISIYNYNMTVAIKDNGELLEFNSDVSLFDYILKNKSSLRRMIIDDYNFRMISENFTGEYKKAMHYRIKIPNNTRDVDDMSNINLFTTENINQMIIEDKIYLRKEKQIKNKGNDVYLRSYLPSGHPFDYSSWALMTRQQELINAENNLMEKIENKYVQRDFPKPSSCLTSAGENERFNEKKERMIHDVLMDASCVSDYDPILQSRKRHSKKKKQGRK